MNQKSEALPRKASGRLIALCSLWALTGILAAACSSGSLSSDAPPTTEAEESQLLSVSSIMDPDNTPLADSSEEMEIPSVSRGSKSRQEVLIAWGSPGNLDSKHLSVTSRCTECHPPPYVDNYKKAACSTCHETIQGTYSSLPGDEICIACHGGTRGAVINLTADYKPINPHDYHYTTGVTCIFCHAMHQPTPAASSCGLCHEAAVTAPAQ